MMRDIIGPARRPCVHMAPNSIENHSVKQKKSLKNAAMSGNTVDCWNSLEHFYCWGRRYNIFQREIQWRESSVLLYHGVDCVRGVVQHGSFDGALGRARQLLLVFFQSLPTLFDGPSSSRRVAREDGTIWNCDKFVIYENRHMRAFQTFSNDHPFFFHLLRPPLLPPLFMHPLFYAIKSNMPKSFFPSPSIHPFL